MALKGLGNRIRQYRQVKKWLQEDLAERAGLSVSYIGMLERDEKFPKLDTLIRIADELDVTPNELLVDSLKRGYEIKISKYTEQIGALPPAEQERIYDVLDSLLKNR